MPHFLFNINLNLFIDTSCLENSSHCLGTINKQPLETAVKPSFETPAQPLLLER